MNLLRNTPFCRLFKNNVNRNNVNSNNVNSNNEYMVITDANIENHQTKREISARLINDFEMNTNIAKVIPIQNYLTCVASQINSIILIENKNDYDNIFNDELEKRIEQIKTTMNIVSLYTTLYDILINYNMETSYEITESMIRTILKNNHDYNSKHNEKYKEIQKTITKEKDIINYFEILNNLMLNLNLIYPNDHYSNIESMSLHYIEYNVNELSKNEIEYYIIMFSNDYISNLKSQGYELYYNNNSKIIEKNKLVDCETF